MRLQFPSAMEPPQSSQDPLWKGQGIRVTRLGDTVYGSVILLIDNGKVREAVLKCQLRRAQ